MFDWVLNTPLSSFYKITLKVSESKEKGSNDNLDEGTSNVIQIRKMFTNGDQLQEFRCKEILQVLVKTFNVIKNETGATICRFSAEKIVGIVLSSKFVGLFSGGFL